MEVITTHLNADFDGLASMIAAKKLYPDAVLAFSGSQEKNLRDFFVQSMEYLYNFERLKNIPLKKVKKLILVDTRQGRRLGKFQECLSNPGLEIHIYDHHPDTPEDLEGDVEFIKPVGSTTTIMAEIFQERKIAISKEEATIMAMAIYEDTGSFTFDTTTPEDLKAMSWLLSQGANLHTVSQFISQELTSYEISLLHELIKSATTYTIQGIDIVVAKLTLPEYVDEFALLVRRFMVMENLNNLFALANMGDRTYLIARSRIPEVNVGNIARDFGGGGHASAASATIKDMTLIEAEEKLIQLLHKHVRPESMAAELMSSPVISVTPEVTINEANDLLTRYNITVLPVVEDKKKIIGLISRRVASKAIFHGLGDQSVTDYMTTDFATLPSTATLAEIQELIIEHRQRFIPVVDNGTVKGVITRTDLLNMLVKDPSHMPRNLLTGKGPSAERSRNLSNLMTDQLAKDIIVLLRGIGEIAKKNGYRAYAVGGFVRDLLLHVKNLDIDIVIEGDGIAFAKKLAKHLCGKVNTHEKFNTAVVTLPSGLNIDVATARLEYYEYPAAMPTVELSSIKLDLYRRDFTINAMAVHLNPDTFGMLVDFFNCQNDLKDRKIRILHNLSFVEDPTRIFRAIRFEQRMGFQIGKHTEKLIKSAVKMDLFDRCYGRRFFVELRLILSEENPLQAVRRMAQLDLLRFLNPNLRLDPRLVHILEESQRALAWHKLLYLDEPCRQWMVYLLALTSRIQTKEALAFCEKFEVPERYKLFLIKEKAEVNKVAAVIRRRTPVRPSEIYWLMNGLTHEGLLHLMGLTPKKSGKKAVSLFVTQLRHTKTQVQGADLKKLGYAPGPIYSTILNHLLEAKLDGLVRTKGDEVSFVKKHYPVQKYRQKAAPEAEKETTGS